MIDAERDWPVLHYVFDVSDVHPAKRIGKKPYLWKMETEHEDVVLKQLEKTYGETEGSLSFEGRIMELAMRIAGDYCEDLMPEIEDVKEGSFLEELDELNVEIRLRDTLSSSIAYTILSRCGADMETWAEELNFEYISDFNTPKIISVLGSTTSELCRPILVDIGKTITEYNKKMEKEPEKIIKNNPEKGLEKSEGTGYNYNQTAVRDRRMRHMKLIYEKTGDYLVPNLTVGEQTGQPLTKYGRMRKKFLKEHRKGIYSGMVLTGELQAHCLEIQEQAEQRMDFLTEQMAKSEGVDEKLKAADPMRWVAKMNNIRHAVEESVTRELIYA